MFFKLIDCEGIFLEKLEHKDIVCSILDYKNYKPIGDLNRPGVLYLDNTRKSYFIASIRYMEAYNEDPLKNKVSFKEFLNLI